jgi:hypothetical protein
LDKVDNKSNNNSNIKKNSFIISLVLVSFISAILVTSSIISSSFTTTIVNGISSVNAQIREPPPKSPSQLQSDELQQQQLSTKSCTRDGDCGGGGNYCIKNKCMLASEGTCKLRNEDYCLYQGAKLCLSPDLSSIICHACGGDAYCNKHFPGSGSKCLPADPGFSECQCPPDKPVLKNGKCETPCEKGWVYDEDDRFPNKDCLCEEVGGREAENGKCVYDVCSLSSPPGSSSSSKTSITAVGIECNGQCIDLSSPNSCGTSCNDIKQCHAPTDGTVSCQDGQCIQSCPLGLEIVDDECLPICPTGASRDPATGQCTCTDPNQEIFNNQCVNKCPDGQTRDPATGQCQPTTCQKETERGIQTESCPIPCPGVTCGDGYFAFKDYTGACGCLIANCGYQMSPPAILCGDALADALR